MNGVAYKAVNTRCMIPWIQELAETWFADDTIEYNMCVKRCVRAFNRMYEIIYESPMFLSAEAKSEFANVVARFGVNYQRLRVLDERVGRLAWYITPKVHMSQHLVELSKEINPRFVQNYNEESQIGSTAAVWSRSSKGTYRSTIQHVVLTKRLCALMVRLELGEA